MRDDYPRFVAVGAEILAIAPHRLAEVERFAARAALPFPLLADPRREAYRRYEVGRSLWSLGQRPGLYLIDRAGVVQYALLGAQQWEIPANDDVLAVLSALNDLDRPPVQATSRQAASDVGVFRPASAGAGPAGGADETGIAGSPASDWQL